jgi:hypothetical protein
LEHLDSLLAEQAMSVFIVTSVAQLDLVAEDIRAGVAAILASADPHKLRTVDSVCEELRSHVADAPSAAVWIEMHRGRVRALLSARVYVNERGDRTAAITWAWGAPGAPAHALMDICVAWAREQHCARLSASRAFGTRLAVFARLVRRHGLLPDFVVFTRALEDAKTVLGERDEHDHRFIRGQKREDERERDAERHRAAEAR